MSSGFGDILSSVGGGLGGLFGGDSGGGMSGMGGPLALAGMMTGLNIFQNMQAKGSQQSAQEDWASYAYPNAAIIEATRASDLAKLGSDRTSAYTNMLKDLSVRGIGPSSGMIGAGAGNIEKGYLKGLGDIYTKSTQFANTPRFPPPGATFSPVAPANYSQGMGPLAAAMVYKMMKGGGGSNLSGANYSGGWFGSGAGSNFGSGSSAIGNNLSFGDSADWYG
jgi:hypothetical protein